MMKKTLFGGILIISIVALAAVAFAGYGGHMWGYGGHMMGPGYGGGYMMGPGYGGHMMDWGNGYSPYANGNGYGDLSAKQRAALDKADQKFYHDTEGLQNKIQEKQFALQNEMSKSSPNRDKVVDLQKKISKLQAELDQKAVEHELAIRKILPESDQGQQYDTWSGGSNASRW